MTAPVAAARVTRLEPFRVAVPDAELADLRERLARTRWPDQIAGTGWDYGTDRTYLRELCTYWAESFDWRAAEARLNAYPQFVTTVADVPLHLYHVRSREPAAMPLLVTHGWPGSVAEFLDVIGPLTDPAAHGGDAADAFHLVVPSLPGFGFSGPTTERAVHGRRIAVVFAALMAELGYDRYGAQGGDIGALVAALLGELDAEHVRAVHLNLLPVGPPNPADPTAGLSGEEAAKVGATFNFLAHDAGYWKVQETRPQTVSYGLNDSPAGLAAWIVEKFRGWTDCDGDVERAFTKDQLLTNISIYWFTQTLGSSARFYYENNGPGREQPLPQTRVPTGYAEFPGEHYKMPRSWAEVAFDLVHWQEMPRGGHFAAMQVPELYVDEVREFFRPFRR
jgi:pimeloyl-ACP methyl ester carboxylesterase